MNLVKVREEMQMITGVVTSDMSYLLYLMLKKQEEIQIGPEESDFEPEYYKEGKLEDWFDKL